MRTVLLFLGLLMSGMMAQAKDLTSRLGVGYRNSYSFNLPSLATEYYPNSEYGFVGAIGIDTEDKNSRFAVSGGVRKVIFMEENLNFFMGGMLSMLSLETNSQTDSGFDLAGLVGAEFFLHGLENLGFSFETGLAVTNVKKVRFRTVGDSFVNAGIVFYF